MTTEKESSKRPSGKSSPAELSPLTGTSATVTAMKKHGLPAGTIPLALDAYAKWREELPPREQQAWPPNPRIRENDPPLEGQRADCARLAKEVGRNSSILRLARKLRLHPRPSGIDEFSWYADCPGCGGKLSISTQTKSFSCKTCGRSGNTRKLGSFYRAIVREKFAGLVNVIEKQIGSIDNLKSIEFEVSWYYDIIRVTLQVTRKEWDEIITGLHFVKIGRGFMSEEGSCQDYWHFNSSEPGSLEVDYDNDGAQGFIGSIEEAFSKVERYRSARPRSPK